VAFSVPVMPLSCDIYTGPWTAAVLRVSTTCNLGMGRRVNVSWFDQVPLSEAVGMFFQLLLPAGTDVRDLSNAITPDVAQVPAGSGRWYGINYVDDVGKGFANEYRIAFCQKIYEALDPLAYPGLFWPVPIP
jgi:hypothetical protein